MDSDSDSDFSGDYFCIVRRSPSSGKKPRPDAVPTPVMAALSPDHPPAASSPMSGDGHSQERPGTDRQGAGDAVAAPMALERRSPDPAPRSESAGARHCQSQPTSWRPSSALNLRPPATVETIFENYMKRRGALIRALTEDEEAFFQKCDPGMQHLQLYGGTDGSWEVKPPEVKLPPPEPEPKAGINIWRDTMERQKWLQKVAVYCDAWLISISHFAASHITATKRRQLVAMIIDLPTVFKEISSTNNKKYKCMYHVAEQRSNGSEANAVIVEEKEVVHHAEENRSSGPDEGKEVVEEQGAYLIEQQIFLTKKRSSGPTEANELKEMEEDTYYDDNNSCASCNSHYKANAFWICCDGCDKWYHGKCVNITSSEAEHIGHFECPDCYLESVGHA